MELYYSGLIRLTYGLDRVVVIPPVFVHVLIRTLIGAHEITSVLYVVNRHALLHGILCGQIYS